MNVHEGDIISPVDPHQLNEITSAQTHQLFNKVNKKRLSNVEHWHVWMHASLHFLRILSQ